MANFRIDCCDGGKHIHHDSEIDRIFGPVLQVRSYKNLLYLAMSFPLGLLYFVTMITGLSISAGLAIVLRRIRSRGRAQA